MMPPGSSRGGYEKTPPPLIFLEQFSEGGGLDYSTTITVINANAVVSQ